MGETRRLVEGLKFNRNNNMKPKIKTEKNGSGSILKPLKWSDIETAAKEQEAKMDAIFDYDEKLGYITINAAYQYHIELSRIPDPEGLVHWLHHLTGKDWMTGDLVREFIKRVYEIKGWNLYRRDL